MRKMLEGRAVIVLGAGPSLGHATAHMCCDEGASVVLAARSNDFIDGLAREVEDRGGTALPVVADMNDADDCKRLVGETLDKFGKVDGLVAIGYRPDDNKTITESEDDMSNWRPIVDTNLFGTLQVVKPVVEQMTSQEDGGSIVIINSMNSSMPWPRGLPYAASKAALAAATRTLAIEYGEHKIRVNSLHCGPILNDALLHALENLARERGTTRDEEYERIASMSALGFMPTPEDYMGSVLYLLSDMSSPVTGISLHVNAGRFMV
ncbi:MAG: SDR family oxidoreductase [Novosphingobium sp.]|nr:SDR family oxidoreductase [Novosphingobium sp.]